MSRRDRPPYYGRKITICLILALALLVAAAYFLGRWYFKDHFYPQTYINGFRCDFMTAEEAEQLLASEAQGYVLEVDTLNGGVESISGKEIEMSYSSDGSVRDFLDSQDRSKWYLCLQQAQRFETDKSISWRKSLLDKAIDGLNCFQTENITQPQDARIDLSGEDYVIIPEVTGCLPDRKKAGEAIERALEAQETKVDLEAENCYIFPVVYRDDKALVYNCDLLNKMKTLLLTYDFAYATEKIDFEMARDWLTQDENGFFVPDKEELEAYVRGLAEKYDTVGKEREFHTYDARVITVSGGDYGWRIDQEAEVNALSDRILSGMIEVIEPVYAQIAASRDVNDIGSTYIEINLDEQRMVYYSFGNPVVDTRVVTGYPLDPATATPEGCFYVWQKQSPAGVDDGDIMGDVDYLLLFHDNLGVHDSSWRQDYGRDMNYFDGTPGCVNAPYDAVRSIYGMADEGTPVIIYL